MIVCDTSSYGDTSMCQIWYDYVNRKKRCGPNTKPYKFDLELKVNIISGSGINATHSLMVIDPSAMYGMMI